jgi:PIN domain nuclease of toxin-antitoxin system
MDEGNPRLGTSALKKIDQSLKSQQLGVVAISFWETAMLIEKIRLSMLIELDVWRSELIEAGIIEVPLTRKAAIRAGQLPSFHGDPADRMIVASLLIVKGFYFKFLSIGRVSAILVY